MNARNKGNKVLLTSNEFVEWYTSQPLTCHYCKRLLTFGIDNKKAFGIKGSDKLTIDRMDNDKPYAIDNIVLACRRCNALKGFRFTHEQLLEIGEKYFHDIDLKYPSNDKNHVRKLSDDDLRQVKSLYTSGLSQQEIAKIFKVSKSAIQHIVGIKS
jgi:hypothetical protein